MPTPPLSARTRWPWIAGMLTVALLGSNVWWASVVIDATRTAPAAGDSLKAVRTYACHLERLSSAWARELPQDVAASSARHVIGTEGRGRNGDLIVGHVRLWRDTSGRFVDVTPARGSRACR
ncbi:hypothetical protein [Longibacter sp.]|uniref:hypothetical protein n=1 Tax=Longibacter sp. TaxID=2045415 RepID=UPI003EBD0E8B